MTEKVQIKIKASAPRRNTLYRRVRLNTNLFRRGGNKSTFKIEGFAFGT